MSDLSAESIQILSDLFDSSRGGRNEISRRQFRATYHSLLDELDDLESKGLIGVDDDKYSLPITSLLEIRKFNLAANDVLFLCGFVFPYLSRAYLQKPGESFDVQEFAKFVDLPDNDVAKAIVLLSALSVFDTISRNTDGIVTQFNISENVLRMSNFREVLESARTQRLKNFEARNPAMSIDLLSEELPVRNSPYVDSTRIKELSKLDSKAYDMIKVIRICEELNASYQTGNYLSVASLVRILLDHIPPIFGHKNFKEVANNTSSTSTKKSLLNLENSSRHISDSVLHQHIRKKEGLPNAVTVDFSNDVDVLLSEIIRVI